MIEKFLLCSSSVEPGKKYILHNRHPYFLAEITNNPGGTKDIFPCLHYEPIDPATPVEVLARIMSEMGDWYVLVSSSR